MKIFLISLLLLVNLNIAAETIVPEAYKSQFKPISIDPSINDPKLQDRIKLGKRLYFETKLSQAGDISCNSCHQLDNYGVDGKQFSEGHKKQLGNRNSPTVMNAGLHFLQFWDGRAKNVEEQALGPIMNPVEMAMKSEKQVVSRIKADQTYVEQFTKAFPMDKNPLSFQNIGNAIGAFERTLITPSKFDEYLKGNESALSEEEKRGFVKFVESGCSSCHNGVGLGGQMFQKLGLVKPYLTKDTGRAEITGKEEDRFMFKVPTLRNVEKTSPYFHDGSIKHLDQAVRLMAQHQLGRELSDNEITDIIKFLNTLTGELDNN